MYESVLVSECVVYAQSKIYRISEREREEEEEGSREREGGEKEERDGDMRRGAGLSGLHRHRAQQQAFSAAAQSISASRVASLKETVATFRARLESFLASHADAIKSSAQLRALFMRMCVQMGVDPLRSARSGAFWGEMLTGKTASSQYELGVQVLDACMAARKDTGGVLELGELTARLRRRRGGDDVMEEEVVRAVERLGVLGAGSAAIVRVSGGKRLVRSVPRELGTDEEELLGAAGGKGFVSRTSAPCTWNTDRFDACVRVLLREGLAMVDEQGEDGETLYWFPCLGMHFALDDDDAATKTNSHSTTDDTLITTHNHDDANHAATKLHSVVLLHDPL